VSYLKSYKRLNRLIQNESFEPMISWGLRMALSGTMPVIWGLTTGNLNDAVWITLTAEAISWTEMKGSFRWRVRTLLTGALLAIAFGTLGTLTASYILLSVITMFVVGFLATLLKNIGDRASGLALCVYLLFIICNAYPANDIAEVKHRVMLMAIGAAWPVVVGLATSLLMPAKEPFRRQIALILRSIAELIDTISKSGNNKNSRELGDVYLKEKDVRAAIDNSYDFFGRMAHQVQKNEHQHYQLVQLRKAAGLVAVNVIAIGEEMNDIDIPSLDETLRIKAATLFNAMKEAVSRISIFVITLNAEEKLLAVSHINRLKKLTALIREYPLPIEEKQTNAIKRILKLSDRTIKLLESSLHRVDQMGHDKIVLRSYSLIKTSFLLKPKYLFRNILGLFNLNTLTSRYAIRSAVAATAALFIYKWFNVDHGYWLPFSVMIVIQPYFGATFKKAMDRVGGTVLGGIAGGLLLYLPVGLHIKEAILFLTFILMVYYIKKQYAVAAFIITLNLVLLFNLESAYNNMIMATRVICTIGGALLAVASGFALLPTWDKKWLPSHLAGAINSGYGYFIATFFASERITTWTKCKRMVESKNSDVFDSFNRYMQEPGRKKTELYYDLISYNVRITRHLNNIHLEQDEKRATPALPPLPAQQDRINECLQWYNKVMEYLPALSTSLRPNIILSDASFSSPFRLNDSQMISLEKLIIELKTMHEDLEKLHKGVRI
jgi:uncharacterized membrane protein YccC